MPIAPVILRRISIAELEDLLAVNTQTPGVDALRQLQEFGEEYAAVLRALWRMASTTTMAGAGNESLSAESIARYQKWFMPGTQTPPVAPDGGAAFLAAAARCQRASERLAAKAAVIASDAQARFTAALASTEAGLPKITTLRELHELWIECGEAAYAAAVHEDAYAEAQAEWLAAQIELRFLQLQAGLRRT